MSQDYQSKVIFRGPKESVEDLYRKIKSLETNDSFYVPMSTLNESLNGYGDFQDGEIYILDAEINPNGDLCFDASSDWDEMYQLEELLTESYPQCIMGYEIEDEAMGIFRVYDPDGTLFPNHFIFVVNTPDVERLEFPTREATIKAANERTGLNLNNDMDDDEIRELLFDWVDENGYDTAYIIEMENIEEDDVDPF